MRANRTTQNLTCKKTRLVFMKISKQQALSLILILIALPIFGYAVFGVQVSQISYPIGTQETVVSIHNIPIQFNVAMIFTTRGLFAVGNPVHVKITITDCNVSNFLSEIGIVSFTGASTSPIEYLSNGMPMNGYFNLTVGGDGKYFAEGDLVWYQDINTHVMWLQPMPSNGALFFNQGYYQQIGIDLLKIAPASDYLSINSNHTIEQLTWVLLGLSIIMVQPIIITLFPDKNRHH
jgi:hypothetical protein